MMISAWQTFCSSRRSSNRRVIKRIILRTPQPLANRAERFQEPVEIGISVQRAKLFDGGSRVELMQCFGFNRTFQMQVQLGFRH